MQQEDKEEATWLGGRERLGGGGGADGSEERCAEVDKDIRAMTYTVAGGCRMETRALNDSKHSSVVE